MRFYTFMSVTRETQKFVSSTLNIIINTLHLGEYMESLLAFDYSLSIGPCVTLDENYAENGIYTMFTLATNEYTCANFRARW